jgi:hypothetical protein
LKGLQDDNEKRSQMELIRNTLCRCSGMLRSEGAQRVPSKAVEMRRAPVKRRAQ